MDASLYTYPNAYICAEVIPKEHYTRNAKYRYANILTLPNSSIDVCNTNINTNIVKNIEPNNEFPYATTRVLSNDCVMATNIIACDIATNPLSIENQCMGITQKGTRCIKRKKIYCDYCHLHEPRVIIKPPVYRSVYREQQLHRYDSRSLPPQQPSIYKKIKRFFSNMFC